MDVRRGGTTSCTSFKNAKLLFLIFLRAISKRVFRNFERFHANFDLLKEPLTGEFSKPSLISDVSRVHLVQKCETSFSNFPVEGFETGISKI